MGWQFVPKNFDIRLSLHEPRRAERMTATESWQKKKPRQSSRSSARVHLLSAPDWKSMHRSIRSNGLHRPSNSLLICVTDRGTSIFWSKHSSITTCSEGLVRVARQGITISRSIQVLIGCAITRPLLAVDLSDLVRVSKGRIGSIEKANSNIFDGHTVSASDALWTCMLCAVQTMSLDDIESAAGNISNNQVESDTVFCVVEGAGSIKLFYCRFISDSYACELKGP